VWKVPDAVGLDKAAGVNLTSLTAAQAVFYRMGLKAPFTWNGASKDKSSDVDNEITFFIYGASTSVGLYAAQLVRLSAAASGKKIKLIGAASTQRFSMLQAAPYNYDALVDYREDGWLEKVAALAGSAGVHYAYDCISSDSTAPLVAKTLPNGGSLAIVRSKGNPAWNLPSNINLAAGAVFETFGVDLQFYGGMTLPASPEGFAFGKAFFAWLTERGGLQPTPVRLMPGGLERIVDDGFALLEGTTKGRTEEWMKPISAEKLVYKV
jgi:NADPH:quinone reductase-like Zn-dependent oxidoreductase